MGKKQLSFGDRFVKQNPVVSVVWVVDCVIDPPGLPAHVRLVREDRPSDLCTVSVHALSDRRYFRPAAITTC